MRNVSPRRRAVLVGSLVLLVLASLVGLGLRGLASRRGRDAGLHALVGRFYDVQARGDVDEFAALWAHDAPTLADQRVTLNTWRAIYGAIERRGFEIAGVEPTASGATLDVTVEMHAFEPVSREPAAGFGRRRRVVDVVRRNGAWKIWREVAAEDRLADALVRAASEPARAAVVASAGDASRYELFGALITRAEQHQLDGDATGSLEILHRATELAVRFQDDAQVTRTVAAIARHYERAGDFGPAMDYAAMALAAGVAPRTAADVDEQAGILSIVGSIHVRRGDSGRALETLTESMALRQRIGRQRMNGLALRSLGNIHFLRGDYEPAVTHYRQALEAAEALDHRDAVAATLLNLGAVEHERGRFQAALTYYGRVVALGDVRETRAVFPIALNNIGLVHRLQGRYDVARDYLTRSVQRSEALGVKDILASAYLNLGMIERLQGDPGTALEYYERSQALREASGQKAGVALALNSIGMLHFSAGRQELAIEFYRRSLAISDALNSAPRVAQTLANLAAAHNASGEYSRALADGQRAIAVATEIGHRGEVLWSALAATGHAFRGLRQPAQAREAFEASIAALEQMRSEMGGTLQEQQAFLESRLVAHEGLTNLLVEQGDLEGALAAAERAKARVLLDVLQRGPATITKSMTPLEQEQEAAWRTRLSALNSNLQRVRGRAAADPGRAGLEAEVRRARVEFAAFQSTLYRAHPELRVQRGQAPLFDTREVDLVLPDATTAALEFVVTDEHTLLFVLTRAPVASATAGADHAATPALQVHRIPVTRAALTALVTDFRGRIASRDLDIRDRATRLFELLLGPARDALAGKTALVVVPDDVLWELPFQALQPAADRYLVEDHAVSYAASLTVLREFRRSAGRSARQAPLTLLAFGNPSLGEISPASLPTTTASGRLEPLPDAERQVEAIGQLYGRDRSRVYVGDAAHERRAKAEASASRILHLATHGVLDDDSPLHSYLVLSQVPPRGDDDGLLEAWELMTLDLDADLVVLSACETGRGRIGPGEGVIGMSWAAFVAGSPATVASLWKVQSQSATTLMVEFHRALLEPAAANAAPASKAEALQRASVAVLRDARHRHPFYWAGFVLIGDTAPLEPRR